MPKTITHTLRRISLKNLLSFGPESMKLELGPLNILVGPNASGKSNLIEAISLMRAAPVSGNSSSRDMQGVVRRGGGTEQWIWKGAQDQPATIYAEVSYPAGNRSLNHTIQFRGDSNGYRLEDEMVFEGSLDPDKDESRALYACADGVPYISEGGLTKRSVSRALVDISASVLSQIRDPERFPEMAHLANVYEQIRIYRDWSFGRNTVFREPQRGDMRNDRLEEDFSNLGLILSRLRKTPKAKAAILAGLRDLYEGVTDFEPVVEGGMVQVFFTEGDFSIPATRLSDGTLRYLCLLTILCDPNPPPLVCIEEPELGLHPDILPKLAALLVNASQRTQLIVTTHSDILVDAMTERPECVVVCEKHDGRTSMRRLQRAELSDWLKDYRLGELWSRGHLGGNRW